MFLKLKSKVLEKITENKKNAYENDADRVISIAIIFTHANLSRVLFVAPSVWHMIYSQCFECAFCCRESERGKAAS